MESETERINRRAFPALMSRYALWAIAGYAINYGHSLIRPHILRRLAPYGQAQLYTMISSILIIAPSTLLVGLLVVCYYYALRERQLHTALTETGLAIRCIVAGVAVFPALWLALFINDGFLV